MNVDKELLNHLIEQHKFALQSHAKFIGNPRLIKRRRSQGFDYTVEGQRDWILVYKATIAILESLRDS